MIKATHKMRGFNLSLNGIKYRSKAKLCSDAGGATRIRTGESRICSPLPYHLAMAPAILKIGAADEARTRYLHLGKVALYQMS